MTTEQTVDSLKTIRRSLQDFLQKNRDCDECVCLSIPNPKRLIRKRADLLLELSAIEWTLGTWIDQIVAEGLSPDLSRQLQENADDMYVMGHEVCRIDQMLSS